MRVDPIFAYISILSVIQPARIQDIEKNSEDVLGADISSWLKDNNSLRGAHTDAQQLNLVIAVRRGVFFLTPKGRNIVRRQGLEKSIDNRRLYLMKLQRRRYK